MGSPNPTIETELGTERLCRGCGEYWPVDEEFWYIYPNRHTTNQIMGRCRACWSERVRVGNTIRFVRPLMQVATALVLAIGVLPFFALVASAEPVPAYCASENPRVMLYESDSASGDSITLCHSISNLGYLPHTQSGKCARNSLIVLGDDWDDCADSARVWLPAGWCIRFYNNPDYNFPMGTVAGPRTGALRDVANNVMTSLRFFQGSC